MRFCVVGLNCSRDMVVLELLDSVATAVDQGIFIHIHRAPLFGAQSIWQERREPNLLLTQDWGAVPRAGRPAAEAGEPGLLAWHVIGVNQLIQADLQAHVAPGGRYTVEYQSLLTEPAATLRAIAGAPADYARESPRPPSRCGLPETACG